jgi:malonate-semialdehyde dehydrogenase (acetylating)/methylmalonate-semialdehyde dehydrogenase
MTASETIPARQTGTVVNPATGEALAEIPYATVADIDRVVRTAHEAYLRWRDVPVVDRVQPLY